LKLLQVHGVVAADGQNLGDKKLTEENHFMVGSKVTFSEEEQKDRQTVNGLQDTLRSFDTVREIQVSAEEKDLAYNDKIIECFKVTQDPFSTHYLEVNYDLNPNSEDGFIKNVKTAED
jgi:hypothetical protein